MSKTLAYIRASTDKQDVQNQKLEILEYAREQNIKINEYISLTIDNQKKIREPRSRSREFQQSGS
jgi:DNA invertase Pin-like site-specific DNA recombinase